MRGELALSRASKRSTAFHKARSDQRAKEMRTEAFKWAWDKLEGWGNIVDGATAKPYDFTQRLEHAKLLAAHAVIAPMWQDAPVDSREGIIALLRWAKAHQAVLSMAHERIAKKYGVSTDGVIISRPIP